MYPIMKVEHLTKTYGKKNEKSYQALKGISFKVEKGEFVVVMGASGSGKTTLLNILATLDQPTTGSVLIHQKDLTQLKRRQMADFRAKEIGFIFQDFNLLDNLTARENIALPLTLRGVATSRIDPLIDRLADKLAISQILDQYPTTISGGQKQRVAAARALIHEPTILLADEPTGALDSHSARELLTTMAKLNQDDQVSILMVTHDPVSAAYAQRILFIKDGKIDRELVKGDKSRQAFYQELIAQLSSNID